MHDGGDSRPIPASRDLAGKRQQMRRVVGRVHAAAKHGVITGDFTFGTQATAGVRDERVEPVDGAQ
jgi:hypothetical protein